MGIINRKRIPPPPPLREIRSVEFGSLMTVSICVFFIMGIIYMICG